MLKYIVLVSTKLLMEKEDMTPRMMLRVNAVVEMKEEGTVQATPHVYQTVERQEMTETSMLY